MQEVSGVSFHRERPKPIPPRPVDPDWHCQRSGDCCRQVEQVVMTDGERETLQNFADAHLTMGQLNRVQWGIGPRPGFASLIAGPCPFLEYPDDQPTCIVHEARPYNCRRFGCLRPNVKTETLVMAPLSPFLKYGNVGCVNLRERLLQSRVARRIYTLLQRRAQRWALKHGWSTHDSQ